MCILVYGRYHADGYTVTAPGVFESTVEESDLMYRRIANARTVHGDKESCPLLMDALDIDTH